MTRTLIELAGVSLGYDAAPVLSDISFAIHRGEFIALVGPNGAGKTTLLRGILGLVPVLAGQIEYGFDRAASADGRVALTLYVDGKASSTALATAIERLDGVLSVRAGEPNDE